MPAPKPGTVADWDTSLANLLQPSAGQISAGWANGQIPPSNWFNWWMNLVGQWTDYLRDFEIQAHTWTALQTFAPTSANTDAISATGNGSGRGLLAVGGSSGDAIRANASNGNAVNAQGTVGVFAVGTGSGGTSSPGVHGMTNGSSASAGVWGDGSIGGSGPGLRGTGCGTDGALLLDPQATPSAPSNGEVWVDSTTNQLRARINGQTLPLARYAPSYATTWADSATTSEGVRISQGADGRVQIEGVATSGASPGALIMTLTAAQRPVASCQRMIVLNNSGALTLCRVSIDHTTGQVTNLDTLGSNKDYYFNFSFPTV